MKNFRNSTPSKILRLLQRVGTITTFSLILVFLSGCQSYQPSPLDHTAHAADWRARSPSDEKVRDFARRIDTTAPTSIPFDPNDGLTLAEAQIVALVYNSALRVARLKAGVAQATAEHAGDWDDPEIDLSILKITESVPTPWVINSALSFTIPISGRLGVERARAEAEAYAQLARVVEEEWRTVVDLTKIWLEWSANRFRLEEAERAVNSLGPVVQTADKLAEAGEFLRTESTLFKIEQESRRADVARLRGMVNEGEQEIRMLMGISPTAPAKLISTLASPNANKSANIEETNPKLIRLQSDYEVAELSLKREIRKQYPDLQLGPQFEKDQGQSRIGMIGGIPIPIFNSNKGGIATARASREVARAVFETTLETMEGQLAARQVRLEGVRLRRQFINENIVPLVDQQIDDSRNLLELGESGGIVLLESLSRGYEAKLDLIETRLEESIIQAEIRHLLGPERLAVTTQPLQ